MLSAALRKLLKLEPGEGQLVACAFLQSVLIGMPRTFTLTCASTLFLEYFRAQQLPLVYGMSALVIPLVGVLSIELQRRQSLARVLLGSCGLLCAALLGLLWLATHGAVAPAAFLMRVWYEAEFTLTGVIFWSASNVLFSAQQAKRLFGLVGSGEVLVSVLAGLIIPWFVSRYGALHLLWCSIAGLVLALLNLQYMRRRWPDGFAQSRTPDGEATPSGAGLWAPLARRYPRLLCAMYALPAFCCYFLVDNLWVRQVQAGFTTETELAAFYGRFWAAYGAVTFLFRVLASSRVLAWFGVAGGLILPAFTQVLFMVCIACLGLSAAGEGLVLQASIGLKFFERLNAGSLHYPAYYTLYQPLPKPDKARVQLLAETIIGPLLGIAVSALLNVQDRVLGLSTLQLAEAALPLCALYLGVSVLAARGYRRALESALERGQLATEAIGALDGAARRLLERGLESRDAAHVLYCLQLLSEREPARSSARFLELLRHPDARVRARACKSIEDGALEQQFQPLTAAYESEGDPAVKAALIGALAATGKTRALPLLVPCLGAADPELRIAAIGGMIRHTGLEGTVRAGTQLLALEQSEQPSERALAARALGRIGLSSFCTGLAELLADESVEVRNAALDAAGVLRNPELWDAVVACLRRRGSRAAAQRALAAAGDAALPALDRAYAEAVQDAGLRRELIGIYRRVASARACPALRAKLSEADHLTRLDLLEALSACGYRPAREDAELRALLREELALMQTSAETSAALGTSAELALLVRTLDEEWTRARKRAFLLLSLLHGAPQLQKVLEHLEPNGAGRSDLALELLELTLSEAERAYIPVLISQERARAQAPARSVRAALEQLLLARPYRDLFTRACIAQAARAQGLPLTAAGEPFELGAGDATLERVERLQRVSMFASLAGGRLCDLAPDLGEMQVAAGCDVVAEGSLGTELYVVKSGELRVHRAGRELTRIGPGRVFGELSVLLPERRTATVTTLTAAELLRLHADDLWNSMQAQNEVALGIVRCLAERLRVASANDQQSLHPAAQAEPDHAGAAPVPDDGALQRVLLLKDVALFEQLDEDALLALASRAQLQRVRAREVLWRPGELVARLYIVLEGQLVLAADGGEARAIEAGGHTSELGLLSPVRSSGELSAVCESSLLTLEHASVADVMCLYPNCTQAIMAALVRRLRAMAALRAV